MKIHLSGLHSMKMKTDKPIVFIMIYEISKTIGFDEVSINAL
jgi:hypothetical protein